MAFRSTDSLSGLWEASALENGAFRQELPAMISDCTSLLAGEQLKERRKRQAEKALAAGEPASGSEFGRNREDCWEAGWW